MIGTDGVTIDATGSDSPRERRRHEAEIDSPAGNYGRAGVFAMARYDPCIDEPGEPIEAAESLRERTDDTVTRPADSTALVDANIPVPLQNSMQAP